MKENYFNVKNTYKIELKVFSLQQRGHYREEYTILLNGIEYGEDDFKRALKEFDRQLHLLKISKSNIGREWAILALNQYKDGEFFMSKELEIVRI